MGVPKYRTSRTTKRKRNTHRVMARAAITECPRCHEPKLPHRVCLNCGTYRGLDVLKLDDEE